MPGPVQQSGEYAQRHRHRLDFFALDAREPLPLLALEIGLRERRMENDLGEDVERRIEIVFQRGQADAGDVELRAGEELRAQLRQGVADLQRGAFGGALIQHVERQARGSRRAELIGRVPRVHQQREIHLRNRVPLREHDLQPVGQRGALECGKPRIRGRAGIRQLGAIDVAGTRHELGVRMHLQRVVAVAEPAGRRAAQIRRRCGGNALLGHQIVVGVAGVHLVDRQHIRLAAETTDPLDAANEVGAGLRLHTAQLARRRTTTIEARQLRVDGAFDPREITARLHRRANDELTADLA